jgi:diadenosine tetraphosphatase ApaH/serine/threonine PP2A family protein phosphatase
MPTSPETRRDDMLVRCGLKDARYNNSEEYVECLRLFNLMLAMDPHHAATVNLNGDPSMKNKQNVTKTIFVAFAMQHFGHLKECTCQVWSAVFDTLDGDKTGLLNKHEFALLRRALVTYDESRDKHLPEIQKLRESATKAAAKAKMFTTKVVYDPRTVHGHFDHERFSASTTSKPVSAEAVNDQLTLRSEMRIAAEADWRGVNAAPRGELLLEIAAEVINNAYVLAEEARSDNSDISDKDWYSGGAALSKLLGTESRTEQVGKLDHLCTYAQRAFTVEPTVVSVSAPAKVFGDIHGQFRDLLLLFAYHGFPNHHCGGDIEATRYVFNGDFVDRGAHQLEVVTLLFALKVAYPSRVFLIRGNHEFRGMNKRMGTEGFYKHCREERFIGRPDFGNSVFQNIHAAFDYLPLAAVVSQSVLVLHGGLGDGTWSLDDLRAVQRPIGDENDLPNCVSHALWSDPTDSDALMMRGVHANARGPGCVMFGMDVTDKFCADNKLQLVIRSHQYMDKGFKVMHGGRMITVFSARNYCDDRENDGAFLLLADDEQGNLRVRAKTLMRRLAGARRPVPPVPGPAPVVGGDIGLGAAPVLLLRNHLFGGLVGAQYAIWNKSSELLIFTVKFGDYGLTTITYNDGHVWEGWWTIFPSGGEKIVCGSLEGAPLFYTRHADGRLEGDGNDFIGIKS